MEIYSRKGVPEQYKKLRSRKLLQAVMTRFRVIIPVLLLFLFILIIIDVKTTLWQGHIEYYFIVDLSAFIAIGLLAVLFYLNRVQEAEDIKVVHSIIRTVMTTIILFWGAFSAINEYSYAGGYVTFLLCMMVCGGLFLLDFLRFSIISISAVVVLFLGVGTKLDAEFVIGLIYICVVFGFSNFINVVNKSALTRAFLLEWQLEQKVSDRTHALQRETKKAKQSEIMKSTFLANMSHEIRTPLNAIIGFSKLLIDDGISGSDRSKYLKIVISSGENLLGIVNDIMEVSRLEAGSCDMFTEEFDIVEVLKNTAASFSGNTKISSGQIKFEYENQIQDEELYIKTDKLKLIQILNNIVGNAIKYTDDGRVTLLSRIDEALLTLRVADTGRGIADDQLENIFNRFQQVSEDPYGRKDGVGLGLTIVKGFVDLLGGTIEVESQLGEGTTMTVKLPLKKVENDIME